MKNVLSPLWLPVRAQLAYRKRRAISWLKQLQTPESDLVRFQCNICGNRTSFPLKELRRDIWSCCFCGSTVRWRSIIHALSMELFGASLIIAEFPSRPDLVGIGLSDWEGYAKPLAEKLDYTNTFFHQEPRLDITDVDPARKNEYDFIISSDVFEHICYPVSKAFENARRLLKPGGVVIFSVPYLEGQTKEHFPDVIQFSVKQRGEDWILTGVTAEGATREFTNLTFHGGPGTTVECRLFGKDSLRKDCEEAGFTSLRIHDEEVRDHGICWIPYVAEEAPYRPLIHGLGTPPWALAFDQLDRPSTHLPK
jgi:SAM-dependent methyltransferase